jgi:hypothetical protein
MNRLTLLLLLAVFLPFAGCKHLSTSGAETKKAGPPQPLQISANGVDAAEPSTASAPDGTFYVAWVNHDAKQADVMIAGFNTEGVQQGAPVRVNRQPGIATAWRGDQPSVAVAPDGAVYVLWTARVESADKHGTDVFTWKVIAKFT